MRAFGLPIFLGFINPDKTKKLATLMASISALSSLCVSLFFYFFQDWRAFIQTQIMIGIIGFTFIYFNFSNTPAWLIHKGKIKQANQAALKSVSLFTGISPPKPKEVENPDDHKTEQPSTRPSCLLSFNFAVSYFCITLVFFGKTLALRKIPGNLYITAAFDGICGILGHMSSMYLSHLPQRTLHLLGILIAGCGCFLVQLIGDRSQIGLIISVGLVSLSTPASLHYLNLIFFKTFEPAYRTIPYLFTNLHSRVGAYTSVQIVEYFPAYTFLTFTSMSVAVFVLGLSKH